MIGENEIVWNLHDIAIAIAVTTIRVDACLTTLGREVDIQDLTSSSQRPRYGTEIIPHEEHQTIERTISVNVHTS